MNARPPTISGNCPASPPCTFCNGKGHYWVEVSGKPLTDEQTQYYMTFRNPDGTLKLWARWALDPVDLVRRPCPYCTRT